MGDVAWAFCFSYFGSYYYRRISLKFSHIATVHKSDSEFGITLGGWVRRWHRETDDGVLAGHIQSQSRERVELCARFDK